MIYNMNENINLLENIPKDLWNAYKIATGTASQRNPQSAHAEVGAGRGKLRYAYGSADYKEISKAEALNLVKLDKYNILKLRILYHGDLIEYEVRDNGSVYCIYGNRDHEFIADDGKRYKNIAFAPFKKVIEVADKIYLTNEYDYLIQNDPELASRRQRQAASVVLGDISRERNTASQFTPGTNYYTEPRLGVTSYDTGAHSREKIISPNIKIDASKDYPVSATASEKLRKLFEKYTAIVDDKRKLRLQLKVLSALLKNLEKNKDEYTEEEYLKLKNKYAENFSIVNDAYEAVLVNETKLQKSVITGLDASTAKLNRQLGLYFLKIQDLIKKTREAKDECVELTQKIAKPSWSADTNKIRSLITEIQTLSQQLERIRDVAEGAEVDGYIDGSMSPEELSSEIKNRIEKLKVIRKGIFDTQLDQLHSYENKLAEINSEVDELENKFHPVKQAKKARQKAMDTKELEDTLSNIITFED